MSTDLCVAPTSADPKATPFLNSEFDEADGQFSPDGRWVAYTSDESGRSEVYVRPSPSGAGNMFIFANESACVPGATGDFPVVVLDATGLIEIADSDFHVDPNLNSATLKTTITLTNSITGQPVSLDIDLKWIGIGERFRENSRDNFHVLGGSIFIQHLNRFFRNANVTGTVLSDGTNFAEFAFSYTLNIQSTKSGEVVIN